MSKAEIEAKKRYGISRGDDTEETSGIDMQRASDFIGGYHQAEKDLELTWEDIQLIVSIDWDLDHSGFSCGKSTEEYYKEVLKQFNEERNNYNNN